MTIYLLETKPWDPALNAVVPVNFASGLVDSAALGTPLPYVLRLRDSFTHEVSVFADNAPGDNQISIGSLTINNVDGRYDYLLDYAWGGREVVIKVGEFGETIDSFRVMFTGSALELYGDSNDLTLAIRDNSWKLVAPLQKNKYLGTGGPEGSKDIQNQPKPLAFGLVKNLTPVNVDNVLLTYQFHDGPVEDVTFVYDDAVRLAFVANYGSYDELITAIIPAGGYGVCLSAGFIRLGAPPAGVLTMDVKGQFHYAINLATTVQYILLNRSTLTVNDLNIGDFYEFASDLPGRVSGLYFSAPEDDLDQVLEVILGQGNAFWFFGGDGKMRVRQYRFRQPVASVRAEDIKGLNRSPSSKPLHSVVVNYDRNLTTQDVSSFALSANSLNAYLDEELIWVQTNADGSGGDWSNVTDQVQAYLGNTNVNALRIVGFQEVTPANWISIDPDGKVRVTDPGVDVARADLRLSLNNYADTVSIEVRKIKGAAPWAKITATERVLNLNGNDFPIDVDQAIVFDLAGNFSGPVTWTALDNHLNGVTLDGVGNSRTLSISALRLSSTLSSVYVKAVTAEGIVAFKTVIVARNQATGVAVATEIDWESVTDPNGTKPANNATVGAPPGTYVGDKLAMEVVGDINLNADSIIRETLRADLYDSYIKTRTLIDGKGVNTYFQEFATAQTTQNSAFDNRLKLIGVENEGGTAVLLNMSALEVSPGRSMGTELNELSVSVGAATASVTQFTKVLIDDSGVSVRAVTQLNNQGYITGLTQTNGGPGLSKAAFLVDVFAIVQPSQGLNAPFTPFLIEDGVVKMPSVEIGLLKVGAVTTDSIGLNQVTSKTFWQASYGSGGIQGPQMVGSTGVWGHFGSPDNRARVNPKGNEIPLGSEVTIRMYVNMQQTGSNSDRVSFRIKRFGGANPEGVIVGDTIFSGMNSAPATATWEWTDYIDMTANYYYILEFNRTAGEGIYFNAKLICDVGRR